MSDKKMTEVTTVEIGDFVICDVCNADYTTNLKSGGFIFGSYAYCPACAENSLPGIKGFGEEHHIKASCDEGMSFADFVRAYRLTMETNTIIIRGPDG